MVDFNAEIPCENDNQYNLNAHDYDDESHIQGAQALSFSEKEKQATTTIKKIPSESCYANVINTIELTEKTWKNLVDSYALDEMTAIQLVEKFNQEVRSIETDFDVCLDAQQTQLEHPQRATKLIENVTGIMLDLTSYSMGLASSINLLKYTMSHEEEAHLSDARVTAVASAGAETIAHVLKKGIEEFIKYNEFKKKKAINFIKKLYEITDQEKGQKGTIISIPNKSIFDGDLDTFKHQHNIV